VLACVAACATWAITRHCLTTYRIHPMPPESSQHRTPVAGVPLVQGVVLESQQRSPAQQPRAARECGSAPSAPGAASDVLAVEGAVVQAVRVTNSDAAALRSLELT